MYKVSYLKLVLVIVFMLIVLSISYTGWKILNNNNKLGNLNNTSINIQDKYVEPKATNNQKISGIDISDWNIFSSDLGFYLKYPSDRVTLFCQEKPSQQLVRCNGLTIIKRGATRQIEGPSGANYDTDFMSLTVHDNPTHLSLKDFDQEMYHSSYTNPDYSVGKWVEGKIGSMQSFFSTTTYIQHWSNTGKQLTRPFQDKTKIWYITLTDNKILLVDIKANYSDGITQLYEKILSTVAPTANEKQK